MMYPFPNLTTHQTFKNETSAFLDFKIFLLEGKLFTKCFYIWFLHDRDLHHERVKGLQNSF